MYDILAAGIVNACRTAFAFFSVGRSFNWRIGSVGHEGIRVNNDKMISIYRHVGDKDSGYVEVKRKEKKRVRDAMPFI